MFDFSEYIRTLSKEIVILIHARMIREEGGLQGVHHNKLEGALSRIDSDIIYNETKDIYIK